MSTSRFYAICRHNLQSTWTEQSFVIDLIVVVLSSAGILLMAGYAIVCDKI